LRTPIEAKPKAPPHGRTSAIDPDWLRGEYVVKGRSAHELADELGVAISTVHRHVRKHGFKVPAVSTPKKPRKQQVVRKRPLVDPVWLRGEYEGKHRTLTDIAQELGVSLSWLAVRAKAHGLELRKGPPRRGASGSEANQ
jgi:hypothetical protein